MSVVTVAVAIARGKHSRWVLSGVTVTVTMTMTMTMTVRGMHVSRLRLCIRLRWRHIFDLSFLLNDLKLDGRLHDPHVMHRLRFRCVMVMLLDLVMVMLLGLVMVMLLGLVIRLCLKPNSMSSGSDCSKSESLAEHLFVY